MSNLMKKKGTSHETRVRDFWREYWSTATRLPPGGVADLCDIGGVPATLECKFTARADLPAQLRQARTGSQRAGTRWYAVIRRNRRSPNSSGRPEEDFFITSQWQGRQLIAIAEEFARLHPGHKLLEAA